MRMKPNTLESNLNYHGGEHDHHASCDDDPKCQPLAIRIVEGPQTVTHNANVGYDPPPSHYRGDHPDDDGIQPWDVIDAFGLDYYIGSVLKYILRAGKKDIAPRVDDLRKARNFLSKAIELEEKSDG
jgi:hypothetical protein